MLDLLLTLSKFAYLCAAVVSIGMLLVLVFFAKNDRGQIGASHLKIRKKLALASIIWAVATLIFIVATLSSILDISISESLRFNLLRSFVTQISLGKFLALQALGAIAIAIIAGQLKRVTSAALALALALAAVSMPVFQSHAATGGSHLIAIGTLIVHVLALSLWVGGLVAILLCPEVDRQIALMRFSQLANWAVVLVVVSGTINAWIRMNFSAAWQGSYALLIATKVALTLLLIVIANNLRKKLTVATKALIALEVAVMAFTIFIGTLLSNSQPPTRPGKLDEIESLVGLRFPGQPNLQKWFLEFQPDALTLAALLITGALYIKGMQVMKRRGDVWPKGRAFSFFIGLLVINYAINGAIGVYAHFGFSYHMIEHMILGMIAPIALVLGAPITLALRTLPAGRDETEEGVRNILIRFLHSSYSKFVTHPVIALVIFDGSLFILYFTGLFGTLMGSHLGHQFMNLHFILAGVLFFHVIVGVDPNPKRPPSVVRMGILFAAMSIHAFFSIALMSSTTLLDGGYYSSIGNPLGLNLLENQQAAGAIGWAMGEIPILIALAAVFIQWMRDDRKETIRIDRKAARADAMGEADDLAQYNQFLAELARNESTRKSKEL